jgi:uncharacterized protein YodC (DUF2158 family)
LPIKRGTPGIRVRSHFVSIVCKWYTSSSIKFKCRYLCRWYTNYGKCTLFEYSVTDRWS